MQLGLSKGVNKIKNRRLSDGFYLLYWCYLADAIQTAAEQLHGDYMLKDMVETFELSGDLLTV